MEVLGIIYAFGLMLTWMFCAAHLVGEHWQVKQRAARALFLSPVWPLMAVYVIVTGIRHVWKLANWKDR
jgi:hypothetical protein